MDIYIERGVWKIVVIAMAAIVISIVIAIAVTPSRPSNGPSIRTEELIFEDCLDKSRADSNYPTANQPMVVRECRIAAAQMVGRLPRTQ